jgi:5-methylcytosine-specific restriction enzyme subunit McrC
LLLFSEVEDVTIAHHHFSQVHLNRNTERYRPLLEFCKIVLKDRSTTPSVGSSSSFVLLFPMEEVFEKFIANFIRRNHRRFNLPAAAIHVQARGHTKWLVNKENGGGKFQLKPDILIKKPGESTVVIDTKWKVLKTNSENYRNNISQADLYQLFAYAHRYGSEDNVLLYPKIVNLEGRRFWVPDTEPEKRLRIEFVDVSQDMLKNQEQLFIDLFNVLQGESQSNANFPRHKQACGWVDGLKS